MAERNDTANTTQSHRGSIIPYCVVLGVISTPVICARLWTRGVILKRFAIEDALIGIALILNVLLLSFIGLAVGSFGYNSHTWQLSTAQLVHAAQWLFVGDIFYIVTVGLTKVGILLFYSRLANDSTKFFMYGVYIMMLEVAVYKIIYLFLAIFTCHPIQARWLQIDNSWTENHQYTCINLGFNILVNSTISAVEDLIIALLPILIIRKMQISKRQKFALWCVFGIGSLTAVFGFLRSYFLYRTFFTTRDWIWEVYWAWLLSGAEMTIGLMCASVPVLKPFYRHYFKKGDDTTLHNADDGLGRIPKDSGIGMYSWLKNARREAIYKRRPGHASLLQTDTSIFDGTTTFEGTASNVNDVRPRLTTTQSWATWTPSKESPEDCELGSADLFKSQRKKNAVKTMEAENAPTADRMVINVCSDVDVVEVVEEETDNDLEWESAKRCASSI